MKKMILLVLICLSAFLTRAQSQTSDDAYTRYELLDPISQSFRVMYEVTATKPGTEFYFNALRKGSEHKVDRVVDLRTGEELKWTVVNGVNAKKAGYPEADPEGSTSCHRRAQRSAWKHRR